MIKRSYFASFVKHRVENTPVYFHFISEHRSLLPDTLNVYKQSLEHAKGEMNYDEMSECIQCVAFNRI